VARWIVWIKAVVFSKKKIAIFLKQEKRNLFLSFLKYFFSLLGEVMRNNIWHVFTREETFCRYLLLWQY
jgi:hypothetical protein